MDIFYTEDKNELLAYVDVTEEEFEGRLSNDNLDYALVVNAKLGYEGRYKLLRLLDGPYENSVAVINGKTVGIAYQGSKGGRGARNMRKAYLVYTEGYDALNVYEFSTFEDAEKAAAVCQHKCVVFYLGADGEISY